MAFITHFAYTYHSLKLEKIEISPYFQQSLYQLLDTEDCLTMPQTRKLTQTVRTSKMIKDYIDIDKIGTIYYNRNDEASDYVCSIYACKDSLKELSKEFEEGRLVTVNVSSLIEKKGLIERSREFSYEVGGHFFSNNQTAEKFSRENGNLPVTHYTYIDQIMMKECSVSEISFAEFDKQERKEGKTYKHDVALRHTVKINRSNLLAILNNPIDIVGDKGMVYNVLMKILMETTDENPYYELAYYQTKQGRYYVQGSSFQMLPNKIRKAIMSDYVELDIRSAIYSLYLNLAKRYEYKGDMSMIRKFVDNPKDFRYSLATTDMPYESVKTFLTAIAYGARLDVYNAYMQLENPMMCKHKTSLFDINADKWAILELMAHKKVDALYTELHSLGSHIMQRMKKNGMLTNAIGNTIYAGRDVSFGTKMAHIYQAIESQILMCVAGLEVDGISLKDMNAIGLYLHDGLYIHKDVASKFDDLCKAASDKVANELGFEITYEMECCA